MPKSKLLKSSSRKTKGVSKAYTKRSSSLRGSRTRPTVIRSSYNTPRDIEEETEQE